MNENSQVKLASCLRILNLNDEEKILSANNELSGRLKEVIDTIDRIDHHLLLASNSNAMNVSEKLVHFEQQLHKIELEIDEKDETVIENLDHLKFYLTNFQIFDNRVERIENELTNLGVTSIQDSEKIANLVSLCRKLKDFTHHEIENSDNIRNVLERFEDDIKNIQTFHKNIENNLNLFQNCIELSNVEILQAINDCDAIHINLEKYTEKFLIFNELLSNFQGQNSRFIALSDKLKAIMTDLKTNHYRIQTLCAEILLKLTVKSKHWTNFNEQFDKIDNIIQRSTYMVDLLTLRQLVNYNRLVANTSQLEVYLLKKYFKIFYKCANYNYFVIFH